jgi:hypothetical protein
MTQKNEDSPGCCNLGVGKSLADTAKRLLHNPSLSTRENARRRLDICKSCEFYKPETSQCSECGCFMPMKVTFANMICPLHKWSENEN